jgi:hypothetical protein
MTMMTFKSQQRDLTAYFSDLVWNALNNKFISSLHK